MYCMSTKNLLIKIFNFLRHSHYFRTKILYIYLYILVFCIAYCISYDYSIRSFIVLKIIFLHKKIPISGNQFNDKTLLFVLPIYLLNIFKILTQIIQKCFFFSKSRFNFSIFRQDFRKEVFNFIRVHKMFTTISIISVRVSRMVYYYYTRREVLKCYSSHMLFACMQ